MTVTAPPTRADRATFILGTLNAQGYPTRWLHERCGTGPDALAALAKTLGETMATPRPGLPQDVIDATAAAARAAGHYPPAAYDDDGQLVPDAIPDHPWQRTNDTCARRLHALTLLRAGVPTTRAAEAAGVHRATIDRLRADADRRSATIGVPAWEAAVTAALNEWDQGENPTLIALRLGLIAPTTVPADHPALAAHRAATN